MWSCDLRSCLDGLLYHCPFLCLLTWLFFHRPSGKLDFIDHVVGNQSDNEMVPVVEWYKTFLNTLLNLFQLRNCEQARQHQTSVPGLSRLKSTKEVTWDTRLERSKSLGGNSLSVPSSQNTTRALPKWSAVCLHGEDGVKTERKDQKRLRENRQRQKMGWLHFSLW